MTRLPPLPKLEGPRWREVLFVSLTCVPAFFAFLHPLWDGDTFWHLAVGREMWRTGGFVTADAFSFTVPGAPWNNFEWLFQLLGYGAWCAGGEGFLVWLAAAAGVASLLLMYRLVRLAGGGSIHFALIVLLTLPLFAERVRFRPDLLTALLLPALVEVLMRWEEDAVSKTRACALAAGALFLAWAQCHAGWAFGLVVMGAFFAGVLLERSLRKEPLRARCLSCLAIGGVSVLSLLISPAGWRALWVPVAHLFEFFGPDKVPLEEWQRTPWAGYYLLFNAGSLAFGLYILLSKKSSWAERLLVSSQVFLSLYWVRYPMFGVLAASPVLARRMRSWLSPPLAERVASGLCLILIAWALLVRMPSARSSDDRSESLPIQEVSFMKAHGIRGNVLAGLPTSSYLDWAFYPDGRVAFDGRFFPFVKVLKQYRDAHRSFGAYRSFLNAWPVTIALYPNPPEGYVQRDEAGRALPRGPSFYLYPPSEWALVYFGNYGMVFLRRVPGNSASIQAGEYALLRPDEISALLSGALPLPPDPRALEGEVERRLASPDPYALRGGLLRLEAKLAGGRR
jgi:hypothetical protein